MQDWRFHRQCTQSQPPPLVFSRQRCYPHAWWRCGVESQNWQNKTNHRRIQMKKLIVALMVAGAFAAPDRCRAQCEQQGLSGAGTEQTFTYLNYDYDVIN